MPRRLATQFYPTTNDPAIMNRDVTIMKKRAAIRAIKSFLPEGKLTNEQLAAEFGDWHAGQILSKTGVAVSGVAGANETASDLGVAAGQRLFESGACGPDEIDFLLFCTQS